MVDLKVTSKKYNDKDVLEVEGDKLAVKFAVANIQALTDEELNNLKVGDVVQKQTGNQKHCYIVTYKEEKHGICLSYFDGSGYIETVSYDYTDGHWVFNSKDVCNVEEELGKKANLAGAVFTGDVIAKTLLQNQANWVSENISFIGNAGLTVENIYNRFEQIGNILYLVINLKVTNETENSISTYAPLNSIGVDLPQSIASKIFDLAGNPVTEGDENYMITAEQFFVSAENMKIVATVPNYQLFIGLENTDTTNRVSITNSAGSAITFASGRWRIITGRIALTLL